MGEYTGSFFEEIDWKKEKATKSEFIAVVDSEALGKINLYSSLKKTIT
jgi:hypothetical protein